MFVADNWRSSSSVIYASYFTGTYYFYCYGITGLLLIGNSGVFIPKVPARSTGSLFFLGEVFFYALSYMSINLSTLSLGSRSASESID